MKRYKVNKNRSAQQFKSNTYRTKAINIAPAPMRGGYRL